MFGEQLFNRDFRLLYFGGIVLALRRKPNLPFFEAIEHIAFRNRIEAYIVNLANRRPFFHINVDHPAYGGLLAFKTNILEISGIPQRIKVALDGCRIVDVTRTGKYTRADGFSWNAPVPMNVDVCNQLLLKPSALVYLPVRVTSTIRQPSSATL